MSKSPKIIVLIGYMGSGKSVIANRLANRLDLSFVDLDDFLEEKTDKSISQIFEEHGGLGFRNMERQVLHELLEETSNKVLSLGGGTPCYYDNMDIVLQKATNVIFLDVTVNVLVDRLWKEKNHRPVIAHLETKESLAEFVGKHLFERRPFYRKASTIIVVNRQSPDEIVQQIVASL